MIGARTLDEMEVAEALRSVPRQVLGGAGRGRGRTRSGQSRPPWRASDRADDDRDSPAVGDVRSRSTHRRSLRTAGFKVGRLYSKAVKTAGATTCSGGETGRAPGATRPLPPSHLYRDGLSSAMPGQSIRVREHGHHAGRDGISSVDPLPSNFRCMKNQPTMRRLHTPRDTSPVTRNRK